MDCHLLEAVDDEREYGCGDLERSRPTTHQQQHPIDSVRWPELIVELL